MAQIAATIKAGTDHDGITSQVGGILRGITGGNYRQDMLRHPLGFFCLPIWRTGSGGLCIHVWMGGADLARLTTSRIHLHTWSLYSYILCGVVENRRIEVVPDESAPTHRIFEIFSKDDDDRIRPTDQTVSSRVAGVQRFVLGDRYYVRPNDYHQTVVPDRHFTATVMLAVNWDPSPQLGLGPVERKEHVVRRQRCSESETREVAAALLGRISPGEHLRRHRVAGGPADGGGR